MTRYISTTTWKLILCYCVNDWENAMQNCSVWIDLGDHWRHETNIDGLNKLIKIRHMYVDVALQRSQRCNQRSWWLIKIFSIDRSHKVAWDVAIPGGVRTAIYGLYDTTLFYYASHTQQKLVSRWGVGNPLHYNKVRLHHIRKGMILYMHLKYEISAIQ